MPASPEEKMGSDGSEGVAVPIRWEFPDDLTTVYAAHVSIRHTQNDFVVSFFQIKDPSGTTEEQFNLVKSQGYISARCVARIALTASTMSELIETMQDSYQKYLVQLQESGSNGE